MKAQTSARGICSRVLREEQGSSIVMVLVLLTVVTTLVGAVTLVVLTRHRLVIRDIHRVQALYAAEAGVYTALARYVGDPAWRASREPLAVPGFDAAAGITVSARALGGYLQIRGDAEQGEARATVRALFGQEPFESFENAVILGDTATALTLTGRTNITGDVATGPRGVRAASLRQTPFSGRLRGSVHRAGTLPMPALDTSLFEETAERLARYAAAVPDSIPPYPAVWEDADEWGLAEERLFQDSLRILHVGPGGAITPADSTLLDRPVLIAAAGSLTLSGPLRLPRGSIVAAGGELRLAGVVEGDDLLLYGERVVVAGPVRLSAQVLAGRALAVGDGARLRYPSVLYVAAAGKVGGRDDLIEIGQATVEGTVVYPPYHEAGGGLASEPARILLGPGSEVWGSVYGGRRVQAEGRVEGTLLAHQFYFFSSPTAYVNWLNGPVIDRSARPDAYVLPFAFPGRARPVPVAWEEVVGQGQPQTTEPEV